MDPILYWNDVSLEANRISHTNGKDEQTGPTLSSRALAITWPCTMLLSGSQEASPPTCLICQRLDPGHRSRPR